MAADRVIASPANPRVRAAAALRNRRERERTGLILIDGARELLRALDGEVAIDTIFVCHERCRSAACAELLRGLGTGDPRLVPVTEPALSKIAFGDRTDGVVGVARRPDLDLGGLRLPDDPLVVVVECVEQTRGRTCSTRMRSGPASGRSSRSLSPRHRPSTSSPGCASGRSGSWWLASTDPSSTAPPT
jgi:hypothetical protein